MTTTKTAVVVMGVAGSGKSTIADLLAHELGWTTTEADDAAEDVRGKVTSVPEGVRRVVVIDQKPIGRTPRSNVATYTGLFDDVRKLYAATDEAKKRGYRAGRFSFNVVGGRCPTCEGEGSVMVELLFLPSVYAPCPDCHGSLAVDADASELVCTACGLAYPVRDRIPVLLVDEARRPS